MKLYSLPLNKKEEPVVILSEPILSFEGGSVTGLLFCKTVSTKIELPALRGRRVGQVDSRSRWFAWFLFLLRFPFFLLLFCFFFFFFDIVTVPKRGNLSGRVIPGIFCPLSLTLFLRSLFTLASVTHSNGYSLKKTIKKKTVKLYLFKVNSERSFCYFRLCFQNLKCTITACTIFWRVVGHNLISFFF